VTGREPPRAAARHHCRVTIDSLVWTTELHCSTTLSYGAATKAHRTSRSTPRRLLRLGTIAGHHHPIASHRWCPSGEVWWSRPPSRTPRTPSSPSAQPSHLWWVRVPCSEDAATVPCRHRSRVPASLRLGRASVLGWLGQACMTFSASCWSRPSILWTMSLGQNWPSHPFNLFLFPGFRYSFKFLENSSNIQNSYKFVEIS
jgi:hypothetical protein